MDANQAWLAVVGQLEMELPRASFDTWVKKTQFLAYNPEALQFEIGAPSAFIRDWLDSRLKQLLSNKRSRSSLKSALPPNRRVNPQLSPVLKAQSRKA